MTFQANNEGSFYEKGEERLSKGDYKGAVSWFVRSANEGDAWAQYSLGNCYYNGMGVRQNYEEAIKWYSKAADQGLAAAQDRLASLKNRNVPAPFPFNPYYPPNSYPITNPSNNGYGTFVSNNPQQTAMWEQIERNMNQNGLLSDRQINELISKDPIFQKAIEEEKKGNLAERNKYIRQSAEQGNPWAQFYMGQVCENENNYEEARKWYNIASQGGIGRAQNGIERLNQVEARITAEKEEAELHYLKSIGAYNDPRFAELVAKQDARERQQEAIQKAEKVKKEMHIFNLERARELGHIDFGNETDADRLRDALDRNTDAVNRLYTK